MWSLRILKSEFRSVCTSCLPIILIEPLSAASRPERQYSKVDLPDPLDPTILTISPRLIVILIPFSTFVIFVLLPWPLRKDLVTFCAMIASITFLSLYQCINLLLRIKYHQLPKLAKTTDRRRIEE